MVGLQAALADEHVVLHDEHVLGPPLYRSVKERGEVARLFANADA